MKKTYLEKGFTLIELLVVIAIIGILSGIVISNLNSARGKSADVAVKAGMAAIRDQAEIFYDIGNTYGASSICTLTGAGSGSDTGMFADSVVKAQITQIKSQLATGGTVVCSTDSTGQKWAVSTANLKGNTAAPTWCVDNSGWNKAGASAAGVCS